MGDSSTKIRLNKLIADSGLASRRGADKIIEEGLVTVNGKKVYELGIKVDPRQDKIFVDKKPLRPKIENVYIMLHKPPGVLTTMEDPLDRPTIKKYIEHLPVRVFPVGRLDWDSEGLLILTNDGDYANNIMHPTKEVTKTYLVKVDGHPADDKLAKLLKGVTIVGGKVAAKSVEKVKRGADKYDWLKIVITEGKNRQIRQMFEKIGFDVLKLQRVSIGRLKLGSLERGDMTFLSKEVADRVFMADAPEEVLRKKSYKGRAQTYRKNEDGSPAVAGEKQPRRQNRRSPYNSKGPRKDLRNSGVKFGDKSKEGAEDSASHPRKDSRGPRKDSRGPRKDFRKGPPRKEGARRNSFSN